MKKIIKTIMEDAKIAYRQSIIIEDKIIEDQALSIIANAKFILNELENNKMYNKKDFAKNKSEIEIDEINKVKRKVPLWLNKPNQYNYKILSTFMKLSNNNKYPISVSLLEKHSKIEDSKKFISHYNQMKIISERNHAKVFQEESGQVTLWKPIEGFVVNQFEEMK